MSNKSRKKATKGFSVPESFKFFLLSTNRFFSEVINEELKGQTKYHGFMFMGSLSLP